MKLLTFLSLVCFFLIPSLILSQDENLDNWHHFPTSNTLHKGISTIEAYDLLKNITPKEVIVAVIDTGVDHLHEDLNNIMWVNMDEIPSNGKDDDNNGYIDDIHGWNFLGNSEGENVNAETLIETRIYAEHFKYKGDFNSYKKAVKAFHTNRENTLISYNDTKNYLNDVLEIESTYEERPITIDAFKSFKVRVGLEDSKKLILTYLSKNNNSITNFSSLKSAVKNNLENYKTYLNFYYNPNLNLRELIGDNFIDNSERYYGNNDSKGPNPNHGTHVAGIIAAERNNNLGINGIANNVQIMAVRVVPNGDEYDKDVANAIYYAVDNGASIINMSFGKLFSWNKQIVDDAVRYAEKHDVLLVHAAGNSAQELNGSNNFPNQLYEKRRFLGPKQPKNWIEVGATTFNYDENFVASFSNYDSDLVDIFAPGYQILSTTPESNYAKFSGTSMSSPMVTGVAALLRGYFPKLSAKKIREIILESGSIIDLEVLRPSDNRLVSFKTLSLTGSILNAKAAIEMASKG